jgi:hypothetical protein
LPSEAAPVVAECMPPVFAAALFGWVAFAQAVFGWPAVIAVASIEAPMCAAAWHSVPRLQFRTTTRHADIPHIPRAIEVALVTRGSAPV